MTFLTEGFNLLLLALGAATIGYEMVNGELAYYIKKFFGLHQPSAFVLGLSSPKIYRRAMGLPLTLLLSPILLPVILMFNVHRFLFKVLNCVYCTAFWLALITAYCLTTTVIPAVLIATTSLFFAGVYNLIRKYSA